MGCNNQLCMDACTYVCIYRGWDCKTIVYVFVQLESLDPVLMAFLTKCYDIYTFIIYVYNFIIILIIFN